MILMAYLIVGAAVGTVVSALSFASCSETQPIRQR